MTVPFTLLHNVLVPHNAFQVGVDRLEYFFKYAPMPEPEILAVLEPSGSGKSRLLETVEDAHKAWRDKDGKNKPVVRVSVPSKPTIKGLSDLILKELDPQDTRRYTENELTRRIQVLMRGCGTKMLMLDEFQHFYDRTSKKVWHHVTDWLKVLIDAVGCILVVSGLPECTAVLRQCPQFRRRCRQKIQLPQFRWMSPTEQAEFRGIVGSFWQAMAANGMLIPDLREDEWVFRIFCASGGLIGYLKKFLTELAIEADMRGRGRELQLEDFEQAYRQFAITFEDLSSDQFNPFDKTFVAKWTDETAKHVNMVGATIPVDG